MDLPRVVSLFSGAGGLDLGFKQAGFDVAVATDISEFAMSTHRRNFPATKAYTRDLRKIGAAGLLEIVSAHVPQGARIGVIGGPPCQGFSRANVRSNALDPRNELASLYLRAVEELQKHFVVEFLMFENVLGIKDKRHADSFAGIQKQFSRMGLFHDVREFCALDFGVPQVRRRVIIAGFRRQDAEKRFSHLEGEAPGGWDASLTTAIGHLPEPAYWSRSIRREDIPLHPNHWTMQPRSARFFSDNETSVAARSFKRLRWDLPSPTVAYGHREIHVHPSGRRRLSVYEAMILQGFPSEYELLGTLSAQVEQVSNAVPPPMAFQLAGAVREGLAIAEQPTSTVAA